MTVLNSFFLNLKPTKQPVSQQGAAAPVSKFKFLKKVRKKVILSAAGCRTQLDGQHCPLNISRGFLQGQRNLLSDSHASPPQPPSPLLQVTWLLSRGKFNLRYCNLKHLLLFAGSHQFTRQIHVCCKFGQFRTQQHS
jgi:hypothetical protein